MLSLTSIGRPCSGPRDAAFGTLGIQRSRPGRVRRGSSVQMLLTSGSTCSMRSSRALDGLEGGAVALVECHAVTLTQRTGRRRSCYGRARYREIGVTTDHRSRLVYCP